MHIKKKNLTNKKKVGNLKFDEKTNNFLCRYVSSNEIEIQAKIDTFNNNNNNGNIAQSIEITVYSAKHVILSLINCISEKLERLYFFFFSFFLFFFAPFVFIVLHTHTHTHTHIITYVQIITKTQTH